jgi:hypothetical protein
MVKNPQFVAPPASPEYSAHHRVLSQGRAAAGIPDSKTGIIARVATILVIRRSSTFEITPGASIYSALLSLPVIELAEAADVTAPSGPRSAPERVSLGWRGPNNLFVQLKTTPRVL